MGRTDSATAADHLLYNASVLTMDPQQPCARLVAIKGNKVLATGADQDLAAFKGANTRLVDCAGGTVIPGFNDAHCHPLAAAASAIAVNCSPVAVRSIKDIQAGIRRRAGQVKEGQWLRAFGYDEARLIEKRPPSRRDLDDAAPRHPVALVNSSGHDCVLNSLALKLAGIDRNASIGAMVHRDPVTGEPNGLISGRSQLVEKAVPRLTEEELEQGMKLVSQEYLSYGITSVQDTSWSNGRRHWQAWERLMLRGIVATRVSVFLGTEALEEFQDMGLAMGAGDGRLRLAGMKLALDESTGSPHPPQGDINALSLRAARAGLQVAFHVSDVPMLEASLEAMEFVRRQLPERRPLFRLEHCPICPPGRLLGLKSSGAIVVTQPSFLHYFGDSCQQQLRAEQAGWLWPIGSLRRRGVTVALSSDSPMVSANPMVGVYSAVTRRTESGQEIGVRERVSVVEALKMYTLNGACASREEQTKGSISPGKLADLAVLSADITQVNAEQLSALRVVMTIVDGKIAWEG
ncbi:MAG: amidohydrolase [Chloroflexi bacterium]|nr:amidohydrolase [Chloroflexota bacterium]